MDYRKQNTMLILELVYLVKQHTVLGAIGLEQFVGL